MDGRTTIAEREQAETAEVCTLVESERRRLSKAEAILASLCIALDHADDIEAKGTQFSLVAESARDLIATSMECLDSARLAHTSHEKGGR